MSASVRLHLFARIGSKVGWVALGVSAAFSSTRAGATPQPEAPMANAPPAKPAPPTVLHMGFQVEAGDDGSRTLVLIDDTALRIPIADLEPSWACDAQIDGGKLAAWDKTYELDVGCGGGALRARLWLDQKENVVRSSASLPGGQSRGHTISIPGGMELELTPSLSDPTASCDESKRGRDVAIRVEEASLPDKKVAHVRSAQLPLDVSVDVYPADRWTKGERCTQERSRRGDVFTLRCGFVDQPHEDIVELRLRDGALLVTQLQVEPCTGYGQVLGGWRLGCGASVAWPSSATVSRDESQDDEGSGLPDGMRQLGYQSVMVF